MLVLRYLCRVNAVESYDFVAVIIVFAKKCVSRYFQVIRTAVLTIGPFKQRAINFMNFAPMLI